MSDDVKQEKNGWITVYVSRLAFAPQCCGCGQRTTGRKVIRASTPIHSRRNESPASPRHARKPCRRRTAAIYNESRPPPGTNAMPIHNWTRVDPGIFHHFHQAWTVEICTALNNGALPPDFFALIEQITSCSTARSDHPRTADVCCQPTGPRRHRGPRRAAKSAVRHIRRARHLCPQSQSHCYQASTWRGRRRNRDRFARQQGWPPRPPVIRGESSGNSSAGGQSPRRGLVSALAARSARNP